MSVSKAHTLPTISGLVLNMIYSSLASPSLGCGVSHFDVTLIMLSHMYHQNLDRDLSHSYHRYVSREDATLLVMGSRTITNAPEPLAAMTTSLTMAAIRRIRTPIMVVTANTRLPPSRPATIGEKAVAEAAAMRPGPSGPLSGGQLNRPQTPEAAVGASSSASPADKGKGKGGARMEAAVPPTAVAAEVTAAQATVLTALETGGVHVLVVGERHGGRGLVRWLCGGLHAGRGDRITLAQVSYVWLRLGCVEP